MQSHEQARAAELQVAVWWNYYWAHAHSLTPAALCEEHWDAAAHQEHSAVLNTVEKKDRGELGALQPVQGAQGDATRISSLMDQGLARSRRQECCGR
jgi:hypothetical protein